MDKVQTIKWLGRAEKLSFILGVIFLLWPLLKGLIISFDAMRQAGNPDSVGLSSNSTSITPLVFAAIFLADGFLVRRSRKKMLAEQENERWK